MAMRFSLAERLLAGIALARARRHLDRFIRAAHRAPATQQRVLLAKIARDADSDYGREHRFSEIRSYDDYVARVPVQTYDDLRPYVERVMAGDQRALFGPGRRVVMFAITSGSTDAPKYVPVTAEFVEEYRRGWTVFGVKALIDHPGAFLGSILQVVSAMDEFRTAPGVPCGSISGLLAATQRRLVRKYYTTPLQTAYISDPEARYYTIMRFAVPRNVSWMITASPATQLKLARTVVRHAERMIRDIHDGTLNAPGNIPDSILRALSDRLEPNREAAKRLADLAARHDELLPKHYWRLAFLANWTGGTVALHLRDFPHFFGETPVRDIGLLATEGRVSIPLEDGTAAGVLDVSGSFFEFVDSEAKGQDRADVHRCHQLIPGNAYRVLMTTSAGFHRYDIGDHVRVHGFEGQAPVVEFLHRGAHVSSITGEKLTEWQVAAAFERCSRSLSAAITDFVLAPKWGDPPFYRLYLDSFVHDPQQLADGMDRELSDINVEYKSKRSSGRLGPIVPSRLPEGTFSRINAGRRRGDAGAHEQYKHRYLYTRPGDDAALGVSGDEG